MCPIIESNKLSQGDNMLRILKIRILILIPSLSLSIIISGCASSDRENEDEEQIDEVTLEEEPSEDLNLAYDT